MTISIYSFITSILFFSFSILICDFLRRKNAFILHYNINSLLCLIGISVFRLCIPIETPVTYVINSHTIFPTFQHFFTTNIMDSSLSISTILLLISGIGSFICLIRLIVRIITDENIIKAKILYSVDDERVTLCMKQVTIKSKQKFRIILSNTTATPILVGLFTPTIFLSTMVTEMNDKELKNILMHEWHHIINKDVYVKLLIELLVCLMWWNPTVYILKKNLEQALEIRCDLSVTKKMKYDEKLDYLKVLFLVAKNLFNANEKKAPQRLSSHFGYSKSAVNLDIMQRFEIVSNADKIKPKKAIIPIAIMMVLLIFSYLVVFQPSTEPPIDDLMGTHEITTENAHILIKDDGTHWLISSEMTFEISEEELSQDPHNLLTKIYE